MIPMLVFERAEPVIFCTDAGMKNDLNDRQPENSHAPI
jgi:hypothetical protein